MIPASNAQQREPSMEEILASIRRIIEDNENGKKQAVEPEPRLPEARAYNSEKTVIEVDAFRQEPRVAPAVQTADIPRAAAPERRAAPQADIPTHSIREQQRWSQPAAPEARPASEPESRRAPEPRPAVVAAMPKPAVAEPEFEARPEPASKPQVQAVAQRPAPRQSEQQVPATRNAMLSEQVERKVAAQFAELSDAFAARSKKTFDEMAEQMMRPMLQDWLDNNLPMIVERLVREEIERVARGG